METRRSFFRILLSAAGASVAALAAPLASAKKYGLRLSRLEKLKKKGGSATIRLGEKQIILIRLDDNKIKGLAAECTHQKCLVHYDRTRNMISCGCHNSFFDLDGRVLKGPADKNLEKFPVSIDGNRLIITVRK